MHIACLHIALPRSIPNRCDPVEYPTTEIGAWLDAGAAKLRREIEESWEGGTWRSFLVQGELHDGLLGALSAQASRFMIHSTSGAGRKRHFRSGPAMTLR